MQVPLTYRAGCISCGSSSIRGWVKDPDRAQPLHTAPSPSRQRHWSRRLSEPIRHKGKRGIFKPSFHRPNLTGAKRLRQCLQRTLAVPHLDLANQQSQLDLQRTSLSPHILQMRKHVRLSVFREPGAAALRSDPRTPVPGQDMLGRRRRNGGSKL